MYVGPQTAVAPTVARRKGVTVRRRAGPKVTRETLGDLGRWPRFRIGGSVGKILGNVQRAAGKAVRDAGHETGRFATSKVGQALVGAALAASGVGIPLAIGIGAGVKGAGALIKPGGNLREAFRGAYQGAVTGAAGGVAGRIGRFAIPKVAGLGKRLIREITGPRAGPGGPPPGSDGTPTPDVASPSDALPTDTTIPQPSLTPSDAQPAVTREVLPPDNTAAAMANQPTATSSADQPRDPRVPPGYFPGTPAYDQYLAMLNATKPVASAVTAVKKVVREITKPAVAAPPSPPPASTTDDTSTDTGAPPLQLVSSADGPTPSAAPEIRGNSASAAAPGQPPGAGGFSDFVKQNPIAVGVAGLAIAGTIAYAASRGGKR